MARTSASGKKFHPSAITQDLIPHTHNEYELGSSAKRWKKLWTVAIAATLIAVTTLTATGINVVWLNATYLNSSLNAHGHNIINLTHLNTTYANVSNNLTAGYFVGPSLCDWTEGGTDPDFCADADTQNTTEEMIIAASNTTKEMIDAASNTTKEMIDAASNTTGEMQAAINDSDIRLKSLSISEEWIYITQENKGICWNPPTCDINMTYNGSFILIGVA